MRSATRTGLAADIWIQEPLDAQDARNDGNPLMQIIRFPTPRVPLRQKGDLPPCLVPKPPLWGATIRPITHNGVTMPLTEWSRQYGIPQSTLSDRLNRGWTVSRALTSKETNQ